MARRVMALRLPEVSCQRSVIGSVVSTDGLPSGVKAACPFCGCDNLAKFDGPGGSLSWAPDGAAVERGDQCVHFRGFYSTGRITESAAHFRGSSAELPAPVEGIG